MKGTVIALLISIMSFGLNAQNGWIETFANAQQGLSVIEFDNGYNIAGFKGQDNDNILYLHINENGVEEQRYIYSDFNSNHIYDKSINKLLLTNDGGLLVSTYNNEASIDTFTKLLKYNFNGELDWSKQYYQTSEEQEITALAEFENGYYVGINERNSNYALSYISSINNQGEINWATTLDDSLKVEHIRLDTNENPIALCSRLVTLNNNSYTTYFLAKLDTLGNLTDLDIIEFDYDDFVVEISDVSIDESNQIYITGNILLQNNTDESVQMFAGKLGWNGFFTSIGAYKFDDASFTNGLSIVNGWDNGYLVAGVYGDLNNSNSYKSFYLKLRDNGLSDWSSNDAAYDYGYRLNDIILTSDSSYLFIGQANLPWGSVKAIKTNIDGKIQTNSINGFVFKDVNQDCNHDTLEPVLKNFKVHLTNLASNETQTEWTNNYDFSFRVDVGSYLLEVEYFDAVWTYNCDSLLIEIDEENTIVDVEIPLTANFECPLMAVDLTTPILQRCEQTDYRIQVFNNGTVYAENPYLDLELDHSLELIESSRPFTEVNEGLYRFQLGNMNVSEGRIINLVVEVDCDSTIIGQTHCASAFVYPDTACFEVSDDWDGSVIDVDGDCLGDSVLFRIQNKGQSNMIAPIQYYVIEDEAIFRNGIFQLDAGESEFITIAANGATYRLETDENPGYIFDGRPSVTIEVCGVEFGETPSLGLVNSFPMYDNSPFVSIDCQENIQDLNGNLHIAYPTGYSNQNIIREGDELEYFIRFENTTSEAIKNVTIVDTLDSNLDISTLKVGVTSHPYTIKIEEEHILKIHFNEINLSSFIEEDNYGFLKFKISLKPNLPLGTIISNKVQIIMDATIVETADVFHQLGEELTVGIVEQYRDNLEIDIYPNPMKNKATISLNGYNNSDWTLSIYTIDGQLIRLENFNSNVATFEKKSMPKGIYIFTIDDNNGIISTGKLVIQ